ncbi:MAG: threonine--tRNA ligase, partial [Flavobacteriales bacterium]|nr:threonine--tRNA ligase [Flavobacteriales bacterium]
QDDAHIFCTNEQVKEEVSNVIDLVLYIFKTLDFKDFIVQISLRDADKPEKYIGSDENWEKAETAIREVAASKNLETIVEYGEAAFYGPKLDFMVRDAIGRTWQLGTVQIDYNLPERFELEYIGSDNAKHRPVMIHRAPFGSMERFVAILIEHCAGKFPLWLTPEQARVLALSDKYNDYAEEVSNMLENHDIRALVDSRSEKVGRKIRDAELEKIPYMLIVGENEKSEGTVSVRKQGEGDVGTMTIKAFAERVLSEVAEMIAV